MAPKKKAKNQTQVAPPAASPHIPFNAEQPASPPAADLSAYPEVQQNEFLATEAIYPEGFQILHGRKDAWKNQENLAFRLRLACLENPEIFVDLDFEFPTDYPKVPLKVAVVELQPDNAKLGLELDKLITTVPRANLGSECVHEITAPIDDLLNSAAVSRAAKQNPFSLEEERAQREAVAAQAAHQQQELIRKQQKEAADRSEQALVTKLDTERKRREQTDTSNSTEMWVNLAKTEHSDTAHVVQFDQPMTVQDIQNGRDITFDTVDGRWVITRRQDKLMVVVTPVITDKTLNPPQLLLKKIFLPQTLAPKDNLEQRMREIEDLLQQSKQQQNNHIVKLLGYKIIHPSTDDGEWELDILSEWCDKISLDDFLGLIRPIVPDQIRDWTMQLLQALEFFDQHGFVHPALHASNVLMFPSMNDGVTLKLSDGYGTALRDLVDQVMPSKPTSKDTHTGWIAPELSAGTKNRTAQTCLWDLGKVVLQMALGKDVFELYTSPVDCLNRNAFTRPFRDFLTTIFRSEPPKRLNAFKLKALQFFFEAKPAVIEERKHTQRLREPNQSQESSSMRWQRDWRPVGTLGKGGFGKVVKAQNISDQGVYAVKIIEAENAKQLVDIRQEVLVLKDLSHSSIVRYFATWIEQDTSHSSASNTEDQYTETETHTDSRRAPSTGRPTQDYLHEPHDFTFGLTSINIPTAELESARRIFEADRSENTRPSSDSSDEDDDDDDSDGFANAFNRPVGPEADQQNLQGDEDFPQADPVDRGQRDMISFERPEEKGGVNKSLSDNLRLPERRRSLEPDIRSTMYIQMEFCEQKTLKQLIGTGLLFADADEMWRLFRSILEGLKYIHERGITHRDLKPENIFLDSHNNPKIGDFGLATAAFAAHGSGDVGTPFYIAPELARLIKQQKPDMAKLGSKVDMYSLGIMFFEMNYKFPTLMERGHYLRQLREGNRSLPPGFGADNLKIQRKIVLELTDHEPEARPDASELLQRPDIPEPIEEEKFRRYLLHIKATQPSLLASFLKGKEYDVLQDLMWDYRGNNDTPMDRAVVDLVLADLRELFDRHGAMSTDRQGIFPRVPQYDDNSVVTVLGHDGQTLQLPIDLTLPFARQIARRKPASSKCYSIGSIFKPRPGQPEGGEPLTSLEIDFDIVSDKTEDLALKEALVINTLDDVIRTLPALSSAQWLIILNHNDLIDTILEFCRIDKKVFSRVKKQLGPLFTSGLKREQIRAQWEGIRSVLRSQSFNVHETSVVTLSKFAFVVGKPEAVSSQLSKLFGTHSRHTTALAAINRLEKILKHIERLQIRSTIVLAPLSTNSEQLYPGNVMFQCIGRPGILAVGGRYDGLIRHYDRGSEAKAETRAVGFRLSLPTIVNCFIAASGSTSKLSKTSSRGGGDKTTTSSTTTPSLPPRVDVLVTSFDPSALVTSGLDCLSILLGSGVSAELSEEVESMGELEAMYVRDEPYWLVIVKGTKEKEKLGVEGEAKVKVKSPEGETVEVLVRELVEWLRREMGRSGKGRERERDRRK